MSNNIIIDVDELIYRILKLDSWNYDSAHMKCEIIKLIHKMCTEQSTKD